MVAALTMPPSSSAPGASSAPFRDTLSPDWSPPPMLLGDLIDQTVRDHGPRIAVDFMGRTWTYRALGRMIERAARGFQDLGVVKGDRVALCLPNTPYYIVLYFAALKIGAVVVNLNPLYTPGEMRHLLKDSGARIVAVPDLREIHAKVRDLAQECGLSKILVCPMAGILPQVKAWAWRLFKRRDHARYAHDALHMRFCDLIARGDPVSPVALVPDDLAVLQYTGGTTGTPKGAMLTHRNLTANALQQQAHIHGDLPPPQRTLAVLPFFHVFALTAVLDFSILAGAELVLMPRFEMGAFLATIRRKPPTLFFGVPTLFIAINALDDARVPDFSRLRACISGGAPLPLEVRETFEKRTGARVCEGYGLTEASPIVTCNPVDGEIRANSCGVHFPGTQIEIRDPDNPGTILPLGENGEVCVRGPQVMAGYWKRPEETAQVFVEGALRTGDIGHLDADGYLYLVDRLKDVILSGGYNVYPRVIEEAAYLHPAIEEAIAIGIPDTYRGQSAKLFVKLHAGHSISPEELLVFLAGHLNKIEVPRAVEIRDSLPRTMVGKLSKKELVAEERARREAAKANEAGNA